jgi:hypothetical protein
MALTGAEAAHQFLGFRLMEFWVFSRLEECKNLDPPYDLVIFNFPHVGLGIKDQVCAALAPFPHIEKKNSTSTVAHDAEHSCANTLLNTDIR